MTGLRLTFTFPNGGLSFEGHDMKSVLEGETTRDLRILLTMLADAQQQIMNVLDSRMRKPAGPVLHD